MKPDENKPAFQIARIRQLRSAMMALISELDALLACLETPVKQGVKQGVKQPLKAPDIAAQHRRLHRSGHPSKIDADPDLRAFVTARLDTMIFGDIASDVAANFPPKRRVSRSSIHRWWTKNRANV